MTVLYNLFEAEERLKLISFVEFLNKLSLFFKRLFIYLYIKAGFLYTYCKFIAFLQMLKINQKD